MKFSIQNSYPIYFVKTEDLLRVSLEDLGAVCASKEDADIVFHIRHAGQSIDKNKYNILIQTEDFKVKNAPSIPYYEFFDETWGYGIEHEKEKYIYLGYHPSFDFTNETYTKNGKIGFLASPQGRRKALWENCKNKFEFVAEWDYRESFRKLRQYDINLIIHFYKPTLFTPWDRMVGLLSNKAFFILEDCYLPAILEDWIPRFLYDSYDECIEYYVRNPKMCSEIAEQTYNIWKKEFDMRDQLKILLKGLL